MYGKLMIYVYQNILHVGETLLEGLSYNYAAEPAVFLSNVSSKITWEFSNGYLSFLCILF